MPFLAEGGNDIQRDERILQSKSTGDLTVQIFVNYIGDEEKVIRKWFINPVWFPSQRHHKKKAFLKSNNLFLHLSYFQNMGDIYSALC